MSLYKISTRGLLARSLYKLPIRGLFRSLRKSIRALLARSLCKRPIGKISVRDRLARSLDKISIMGLCTMYKISIRGLRGKIPAQALYKRPPCHDLLHKILMIKMSATPQREQSDTPKVPRGLRDWSQNEHRGTTMQSDLWGPKWREGCASDCKNRSAPQGGRCRGPKCREGRASDRKMSTAPQRERCDRHKVSKGCTGVSEPPFRARLPSKTEDQWRSFCAVKVTRFSGPAGATSNWRPTLPITVSTPSVATLFGE